MIGLVGAFGVAILLAREEVLGATEVHLVEILRARIGGDELLHDLHGFDGAPELVVGARLLVEHLVVVLVGRILLEQAVVELDRLERTGARQIVLDAFRAAAPAACPARTRRAAARWPAARAPARSRPPRRRCWPRVSLSRSAGARASRRPAGPAARAARRCRSARIPSRSSDRPGGASLPACAASPASPRGSAGSCASPCRGRPRPSRPAGPARRCGASPACPSAARSEHAASNAAPTSNGARRAAHHRAPPAGAP